MMAPSNSTYKNGLKVAAAAAFTVAFIFFFLTVLSPKSDGSKTQLAESSKRVIGSKPPACANKCMKCRPCMATLIIPNHQMKGLKATASLSLSHREDDSYYLLSWKCRCGDKLFQP